MMPGVLACARATWIEGRRSRLSWALALYVLALCALPLFFREIDPAARPAILSAALHSLTACFVLSLSIYFAARLVGRDMAGKLLYTVFTKPVAAGQYFLGRLIGLWGLATLFCAVSLPAGACLLAWVDSRVGPIATTRPVARATRLYVKRDAVRWTWNLPERSPTGLVARVESLNNLYWSPDLTATFRRLPDGPERSQSIRWEAGARLLTLPVPQELLSAGAGPIELALVSRHSEPFGPQFTAGGTYALLRAGREYVRLWTLDVACLWVESLLAAALALFFSCFCPWPLATVGALTLYLSFHSLGFLREFPRLLEPSALSELFSPTIYRTHPGHAGGVEGVGGHDHGDGREAHGPKEAPGLGARILGLARKAAESAVTVFGKAAPDLGRLDLARRAEQGALVTGREWSGLLLETLPLLAGISLLGWWRVSRMELP